MSSRARVNMTARKKRVSTEGGSDPIKTQLECGSRRYRSGY